ncbi:MAG: hypothetical protein IIY04_06495 [Oscillospiraceae bacterium]|nr:hypothetical protein [Oscillospiraceae bacterium]
MDNQATFLPAKKLQQLAKTVGEPFFVYDEAGILTAHEQVQAAFSFASGFRQYFPLCRTTPPQLLTLLHTAGSGVCCFDAEQLHLCAKIGFSGEEVLFAPTLADAEADALASELGCIRVIGARQTIPASPPKHAMLVYNPGGKLVRNSTIYTSFSRMKWGMGREELCGLAEHLCYYGTQSVSIMLPACSNELRPGYFPAVAETLFALAAQMRDKGICVHACNLAGGLGAASKSEFDLNAEAECIRLSAEAFGVSDVPLQTVLGRYILAPNALFLTPVAAVLPKEKPLIITKASADMLPDATPLGTYHHICVLGKATRADSVVCDVAGSQSDLRLLFGENRILPQVDEGDWLIFHTAGLTTPSVLPCPQFLYGKDGSITAW